MRTRTRALIVALTVIAAAALLALPAAAAPKYKTTIVISLKLPAFNGTLKSPKDSCEKFRTVRVYKEKPGPDAMLKKTTSNAKGRWLANLGKSRTKGRYYMKAPARGNCKASKSIVLPVSG